MNCTFAPYQDRYVNKLKKHIEGIEILNDSVVYELLAAIKLKMVMWDDAAPTLMKYFYLPRNGRDTGIDLISLDFNRAAQVKGFTNVGMVHLETTVICAFRLNIRNLTLVCPPGKDLHKDITSIFKIVRLDTEIGELPDQNLVVNEFIKDGYIDINERMNELVEQFEKSCKIDTKMLFSDGTPMYGFWYNIKRGRTLTYINYDRIRSCKPLMDAYGEETEEEKLDRINRFIDFTKSSNFDVCSKLLVWNDIKRDGKHIDIIWKELSQEYKDDYESYIKLNQPDVYSKLKKVRCYLAFFDGYGNFANDEFWQECKSKRLCDTWPYYGLLLHKQLNEDYHS
jgi:hypothetical protein